MKITRTSIKTASELPYKAVKLVMKAAANVQTLEDLDNVLSSLLSIDKHLYTKYSAAVVNSKSSPAYIGKQISDELYYMLQDEQSATSNSSINATTDADTEQYLHSLVGDVESALANEVDSIDFELDSNVLYVIVTYMSKRLEYPFEFSELTMLWDSIDEDTSYIVNTILQDLDAV